MPHLPGTVGAVRRCGAALGGSGGVGGFRRRVRSRALQGSEHGEQAQQHPAEDLDLRGVANEAAKLRLLVSVRQGYLS